MAGHQYLVLFHDGDQVALRLTAALDREREGDAEVIAVRADDLPAARWIHTLVGTGVRTEVCLVGGATIVSERVVGGVNRLRYVPVAPLGTRVDTEYAGSEMYALV